MNPDEHPNHCRLSKISFLGVLSSLSVRKLLHHAFRLSLISGSAFLLVTLFARIEYWRSITSVSPVLHVLPPSGSEPKSQSPAGHVLISLDDWKAAARKIRSETPSDVIALKTIVDLVSRRYQKAELLSPWYKDWVAFSLSRSGLPKLSDLDSAIEPDEIASSKSSFCSQLSILVMEILKDLGINYQAVRFAFDDGSTGHFAVLAYIENGPILLDAHRKPAFDMIGKSTAKLLYADTAQAEFNRLYGPLGINVKKVSIALGEWNSFPASNSRAFRLFTKHLSSYLWIYLLSLGGIGIFALRKL